MMTRAAMQARRSRKRDDAEEFFCPTVCEKFYDTIEHQNTTLIFRWATMALNELISAPEAKIESPSKPWISSLTYKEDRAC